VPLQQPRKTLAELAEESGVPARTIRYYISRGLLDGPHVAGRAAGYGPEHLERLRQIRALQGQGLTLVEIARRLVGRGDEPDLPAPTAWWSYPVAEDVVVLVKTNSPPWRLRRVRSALRALAKELADEEHKQQQDQEACN